MKSNLANAIFDHITKVLNVIFCMNILILSKEQLTQAYRKKSNFLA